MIVRNPQGLSFDFASSGVLRSVEADPIRISMRSPSAFAPSAANLYLRRRASPYRYEPLLGSEEPGRFRATQGAFETRGSWDGLDYVCSLQPARSGLAWEWRVRVESRLDHPVELDLVYVQEVGLSVITPGPVNAYYASQYLERRVLEDPRYGPVICCRQNLQQAGGNPWLMIACPSRAVAASTDGAQFYGSTFRSTGEPAALRADKLAGELSGESAVVALQGEPFILRAGESHTGTFVATYLHDHPEASSELDLGRLEELVRGFAEAGPPVVTGALEVPAKAPFHRARLLPAEELSRGELVELFGDGWRHPEEAAGRLLSFFTDGPRHVVLREKEVLVDRPHGHIMQANGGLLPDESIVSTTAFACGVFNSHLTQGNTNFNRLLSVCAHPETPSLESGQRIVVELDDGEFLLGVPSAFEMGLSHCRWIYKCGRTWLQVCTWTERRAPRVNLDFKVLRGGPVRLAITHQFDDLNGWTVAAGSAHAYVARPRADSMLAARFPQARFRILVNTQDAEYRASGDGALSRDHDALFVLEVAQTSAFSMSFVGEVAGPVEAERIAHPDAQRASACEDAVLAWRALSRELTMRGPEESAAVREILPWYGMNALVHFLTPHGLEQFSGAAWGTRDVCQGPLELLLCQERYHEAKQVLRTVFANQSPDGGWPQWWMFDSYASVRADSAHGDVVYWCILALCSYIKASGDLGVLDERLPYFHDGGAAPTAATPLSEHVDRIIALVVQSFVPGTALVRFGGGDWNDSLQPVSKELSERLISSWTVLMCYQALREYREVCELAGCARRASELGALVERILSDFNRYLVRDGVVAGYGRVGADHSIDVLLHPGDATSGVRYSLLPMNRGIISGAFTKEQAEHHLTLVEHHLKGPDGARLMDRPLPYSGGPQTMFQRAESSTYFGREIGLMYVHEHLRYAESLARMGRPDAFLHALRQAIPVGYEEVVPQGDPRQANCYYSSSDVVFRTRYEADERYHEVIAGKVPLKGGWRVYSSGPGIYVALAVSRLLGLRIELDRLVLDPVLARSLDGLEATLRFRGHLVTFTYGVAGNGFGPRAIAINGEVVQFDREPNPYRQGGAVMPLARFLSMLAADENRVEIEV